MVCRILVFLFLGLLAACDTVSSSFGSRSDAEEIIRKGWLPESMPESASDIWETHDLDLNIGHGEFSFAASDALTFKSRLVPAEEPSRCRIPWEELEGESREWYREGDFFLAVNWTDNDVKFWMCYRAGA